MGCVCVWGMLCVLMGYVWGVHGVCFVCVWGMHRVCMVCALCAYGLCKGCAWGVHGVGSVCVWGMYEVCLVCAVCMGCVWGVWRVGDVSGASLSPGCEVEREGLSGRCLIFCPPHNREAAAVGELALFPPPPSPILTPGLALFPLLLPAALQLPMHLRAPSPCHPITPGLWLRPRSGAAALLGSADRGRRRPGRLLGPGSITPAVAAVPSLGVASPTPGACLIPSAGSPGERPRPRGRRALRGVSSPQGPFWGSQARLPLLQTLRAPAGLRPPSAPPTHYTSF